MKHVFVVAFRENEKGIESTDMYVTKYSRGELWNLKLSMDGMVGLQLFQLSSLRDLVSENKRKKRSRTNKNGFISILRRLF